MIIVEGTYMFINKVSPSKIKVYNECQYKYKGKYVEKLPDVFNDKQSTDAMQFGSYIHRIFELGYECKTVEEMYSIAKDIRDKYIFKGYSDKKIKLCIDNFFAFNKNLSKTVAVEEIFDITATSFNVNGIIDRVIIGEDGGIMVMDYKTSKRASTSADLYSDEQMLIYAFAAHTLYKVPYTKITLCHYYPHLNKLVSVRIPEANVNRYIHTKLKNQIWEIRKKKKDEFKVMPNKFCNWCGIKGVCPSFHTADEIAKTLKDKEPEIEAAREATRKYYAERDAKKKEPDSFPV